MKTHALLPALAIATVLGIAAAAAHEMHDWVRKGGYVSKTDGSLCCGENDCHFVDPANIRLVAGEWQVRMGDTVVSIPQEDAQWSEDGKYSICIWGGQVKCLFIPPVGA